MTTRSMRFTRGFDRDDVTPNNPCVSSWFEELKERMGGN